MLKYCSPLFLLLQAALSCFSQGFQRHFGDSLSQINTTFLPTNDGGYLLSGYTYKNFIPNSSDIFFCKTTSNLLVQWTKVLGGAQDETGGMIETLETLDGYTLLCARSVSFGENPVLIHTDTGGNVLWTRSYGSTTILDAGSDLLLLPDSGYLITGRTLSSGFGIGDLWAIRTDKNGNVLWNKTYGGSNSEAGARSLLLQGGNILLTGNTLSFGAGNRDGFVIQIDLSGNLVRSKTIGATGEDYIQEVVQLSNGDFVFAGRTTSAGPGMNNIFLLRTDSLLNPLWGTAYGESNFNYFLAKLIPDVKGGYAVCGYRKNSTGGTEKGVLFITDSAGIIVFSGIYGGPGNDRFNDMIQLPDSGFMLSGQYDSQGDLEAWLVRTDKNGNTGCLDSVASLATQSYTTISSFNGNSMNGGSDSVYFPSAQSVLYQGFVFCPPVSVDENKTEFSGLLVYPNPSGGIVNCCLPFIKDMPVNLEIYNLIGERVLASNIMHPPVSKGLITLPNIDLSSRPRGLYIIKVIYGRDLFTGKFILY